MSITSAAFLRGTALAVTLAALAGAAPSSAQAQQADAAADQPTQNTAANTVAPGQAVDDQGAGDQAGEIVVTGSRLAQDPNAVSPSPVVSISAAELRQTGQTEISETLREIPALLNSASASDSIDRGAGGVGQATLDLRGLGSNRTLVLVNGRRHVSGVAGSQTVDITSIPSELIDGVEVLTGGASAVYGADAVTGVVNFKLKQDFTGLQINAQSGVSSRGDGARLSLSGVWGQNFGGGRGNITIAGDYSRDSEILSGARSNTRDNARANSSTTYANPARRFQTGDISAATPNFARYYSSAEGRYATGYSIPTGDSLTAFIANYTAAFGSAPTLTSAEQALVSRAADSPLYAIGNYPNFAISSNAGLVFRGDFGAFTADVDGNGVSDCNQSFIGSYFGGCYVTTANGGVRPFQDGTIATTANQFGGDGAVESTSATSLIPRSERYNINLLSHYDFSDKVTAFIEAKYVRTDTLSRNNYNTFYDALYIAPDNPTIPTALQADAADAGGLYIGRDFLDLGAGISRAERDTYRLVAGLRGDLTPHLRYEVSGNYGRFDSKVTNENTVLPDRLFAAVDAVAGANGQLTCRSTLDPTAVATGSSPVPATGFYTFTPGANSGCVPVNLFGGVNAVSAAAVDWITVPTTSYSRLQQAVAAFNVSGDSGAFFNLPGGAVQVSLGGEYRYEESRSIFDALTLGYLPTGSGAGAAGTYIGDVTGGAVQSLTFDGTTRTVNSGGRFDVYELCGETSLPLLADRPFVNELRIGGAARYSHYSTVGNTFTWSVNGVYAPIRDIKFRGTYARAVRAPNISELFSPNQGTTFRPSDPCEQSTVDALVAANDPSAQNRVANCRADGLPAGFTDPLTARFSGTIGGNTSLREETAKTITAGLVLEPRFIPGLTLSADYYSIRIDDAISTVTAQDIVNTCYDSSSLDNQYCALFTRNRDVNSPTYLGLNFLQQTYLNFGRIETAGVDMNASYAFRFGDNRVALHATGTWVQKLDRYFDPADPTKKNPGLKEYGAPEWSAVGSATVGRGPVSLTYRLQYIGNQAVSPAVQIERIDLEFGAAGMAGDRYIHDISGQIDIDRGKSFYFGVNNVSDVKPFYTSASYPVSPIGRYFFVGLNAKF